MAVTGGLYEMWTTWDGFTAHGAFRHPLLCVEAIPDWEQFVMASWIDGPAQHLKNVVSDEWDLQDLFIKDVQPGTAADVPYAGFTDLAGENHSGALSATTAFVVTWYTALRGRSYRGRTFFPGFALDTLQSGCSAPWANDVLADYANALFDLWTPRLGPTVAQFGVISRQHDLVATAPVFTPVETFLQRFAPGVRRKRREVM